MQTASFTIVWLSLVFYAVLAGADFGIGFWVLASYRSCRGDELRRDAFSYFSPLWEVNGLFLVFFLMGLFTAFSPAVSVLGRALIPLVLAALVLFVLRSAAYALAHHGPSRWRAPATVSFGIASVASASLLGVAAAAPAAGVIIDSTLSSSYLTSRVAATALVLTIVASAHLAALALAAYAQAHARPSTSWFRRAGLASGGTVLAAAALFTVAVADAAPYTRDRLLGPHGIPMIGAGVLILAGLIALTRRRYPAAAVLTALGYGAGLLGGAFAQLPYLVYPALRVEDAASPSGTLTPFVISSATAGPVLLIALVVLYGTALAPAASGAAR